MKKLILKDTPHQLENESNCTFEDKRGRYLWVKCLKCGIKGKRRRFATFLEVSEGHATKKINNCVEVAQSYPDQVKIIEVSSLYQWGFKKDQVYKTVEPRPDEKIKYPKSVYCTAPVRRPTMEPGEIVRILPNEFTFL